LWGGAPDHYGTDNRKHNADKHAGCRGPLFPFNKPMAKVPENDQIGITDSRPKRSRFMMRLLYDLSVQKQENPTVIGQAFRKGVDIKPDYGIWLTYNDVQADLNSHHR
jgi:hypothetical protein